jgi:hypothetical protein
MTQEIMPGMESLAKREVTPATLIEMVAATGDVDKLAALLDLKIKWEQHESKKSFDAALELFRKNKVVIEKTKTVAFANRDGSETSYNHAELDKAAEIIDDALAAVGLTYTWEPDSTSDGKPKMGLVMRGYGHTERLGGLVGPPDASGGKNAMQAIGSSTTYLARYVLLFALGIVAKNRDDDGRSATGGLNERAIDEYCQKIKDSSSSAEGLAAFKEGWKAADDLNDKPARDRIRKVWEEKKKYFAAVTNGNR